MDLCLAALEVHRIRRIYWAGPVRLDTVIHMARRIIHQLVDDFDGEVLEVGEGATLNFSLEGVSYEIDLSDKNAAQLRQQFEPWITAARRVSSASGVRGSRGSRGAGRRSSGNGRDLAAVRAWAKDNGHAVSERGRVPESVLQAYDAAH